MQKVEYLESRCIKSRNNTTTRKKKKLFISSKNNKNKTKKETKLLLLFFDRIIKNGRIFVVKLHNTKVVLRGERERERKTKEGI